MLKRLSMNHSLKITDSSRGVMFVNSQCFSAYKKKMRGETEKSGRKSWLVYSASDNKDLEL